MASPAPWADARARVTAVLGATPTEWPNEPFSVPDPPAIWAAVEMTGTISEPIEMGPTRAWQEEGWIGVHIYTPSGWGTDAARVLAKAVVDAFRGIPGGPVTYHSASIGDGVAEDVDGAWWRLSVHVDYRYQDIVIA